MQRILLFLIVAFAIPFAAFAQIGARLEDCKKQFGVVIDTYPYGEGRATEYEFHVGVYEVLVQRNT